MDIPILIATAAISSTVSAIIATLVAILKTKGNQAMDNSKAMQDGMKLLLMDKTKFLTDCAVDEGSITIEQKALITSMVDTAHALGANGTMTACQKAIDALPLKHD